MYSIVVDVMCTGVDFGSSTRNETLGVAFDPRAIATSMASSLPMDCKAYTLRETSDTALITVQTPGFVNIQARPGGE